MLIKLYSIGGNIIRHVCFYNGEENEAKNLVLSLKIEKISVEPVVFCSNIRNRKTLDEESKAHLTINEIQYHEVNMDDYRSVLVDLARIIRKIMDEGLTPVINITSATPMQAYASHQISVLTKVPVKYMLRAEEKVIEIKNPLDIHGIRINDTHRQIMERLLIDEKVRTTSLIVEQEGRKLKYKAVNTAVNYLIDNGIAEAEQDQESRARGPKPRLLQFTPDGLVFYMIYRLSNPA